MKKHFYSFAFLAVLMFGVFSAFKMPADEHPTLAIGAQAPNFSLLSVDGKTYTLNSFKNSPILMIVFTCDHCPTAQAYEDRIIQIASDYKSKGVAVVAIMPNDPKAIRLDELNYTDLSDTYDEMKIRAATKHFNFPYLFDGATQSVSRAYGPIATPHVFIFDKERKLCYSGRIDDVEKPTKTPHVQDTRNALNSLLAGKTPDVTTTKVFGCSIKWAEKSNWKEKAEKEWAKEPVTLDTLGAAGIKTLLQNKTDSLLVIHFWSTTTQIAQFFDLVDIDKMYRSRNFQMVSVCVDPNAKMPLVRSFVQDHNASFPNYFTDISKTALMKLTGVKLQGPLPYTLVIEPGGKIVYSKEGIMNIPGLKKAIVDDPVIGRYY
jgi:peroxiredoxin